MDDAGASNQPIQVNVSPVHSAGKVKRITHSIQQYFFFFFFGTDAQTLDGCKQILLFISISAVYFYFAWRVYLLV